MVKLLVELLGCGLVVTGVALWSLPVALVVTGVLLVAAVEVRG